MATESSTASTSTSSFLGYSATKKMRLLTALAPWTITAQTSRCRTSRCCPTLIWKREWRLKMAPSRTNLTSYRLASTMMKRSWSQTLQPMSSLTSPTMNSSKQRYLIRNHRRVTSKSPCLTQTKLKQEIPDRAFPAGRTIRKKFLNFSTKFLAWSSNLRICK